MALNMITSIKKAEVEAEKIIKDAQAEAKQILKDATDSSYKIVSQSEEKTEQKASKAVLDGAASADSECREILEVAKREALAMHTLCEPKIEKAAELIISRISR